ncbi:phosphatidylserine/phosphatidylglycerophosphate/cardiolipin synthase family protein, partial [bacterium]|nr:phosphatidylserine/phosphatidylglycerophosphate/cardiolipin synthase family protein [bacterium]
PQVAAVASKSAIVGNSKVTTLIDGGQYFKKAMEFVKGAKDSIQVEMFEFQNLSVDGKYWAQNGAETLPGAKEQQQLLWQIVKKKEENPDMKVQIILDAHKWHMEGKNNKVKHFSNQDMIKFLKEKNIDVVPYPKASQQGSSLQHIKLVIVDGKKALVGGMNWGTHSTANHDGSVAIETLPNKMNGEVDNLMATHFNADWKFSWERIGSTELVQGPLNKEQQALYAGKNKEIKQEAVDYYNLLSEFYNTEEAKTRYKEGRLDLIKAVPLSAPAIKVLGTKPRELAVVGEKGLESSREYLMDKIKTCKKMRGELFVLTDKELVKTIIDRHKKGELDAKFIIEASIKQQFPYCENAYDELMEAGVPVRVYKANKDVNQRMHAKWAVFDNKEVMIGSTNWSSKGLNQNLGIGRRKDYVLATAEIDDRIIESFKQVRGNEEKLHLDEIKWDGTEKTYAQLKHRKNVLRQVYNALKKSGYAKFELDGKDYEIMNNSRTITVKDEKGLVRDYKYKEKGKDPLSELRTVLGYYAIIQRRQLSKQRYSRGNNEVSVAFESPSLAKNVFIKQFDMDWDHSESEYEKIKDKVIPIKKQTTETKSTKKIDVNV